MIRLTVPSIDEADYSAVRKVLESGFLVQGSNIEAFEQAVKNFVGTEHAIAVSNCTAGLHLALLALGVGQGDIVMTTAYSYPATANVIELCGARPVFIDIQKDTYNLDANCLQAMLNILMCRAETACRVKAILPVHTFGQLADMPAILEIAGNYDLPVIEDAACALGAKLHGRQAGSWGVMGCFSFHPRKAITTGEGGIITTNDARLVGYIKALRNHGQDPDASTPNFIFPGFNYRMTEMQGALGVAQMAKLERIISARRRSAAIYDCLLAETSIAPPVVSVDSEPVYQSYVALLPERFAARRHELIHFTRTNGIETTIGTWHIPLTEYYRRRYGFGRGAFPHTDDVFDRAIALPLHEQISRGEQESVVRALGDSVVQLAD
jgi:perosamine synthetase